VDIKSKSPSKTRKAKTKTKKTPDVLAPRCDETTFPFLRLPGEIRNMVYYCLLVDEDYSIRFEATISKRDGRGIIRRLYRTHHGPPDRDDLPGQTKGSIAKFAQSYRRLEDLRDTRTYSIFSVAIFQVCHQINDEATSIFYGANLFVFDSSRNLHAFLTHFHHRVPLLRKLGITGVGTSKHHDGPDFLKHVGLVDIWSLLASASRLEALYLHTWIWQSFSTKARLAADAFYSHAHGWMHTLAARRANKIAALNVLKLPAVAANATVAPKWSTNAAAQAEFRNVLARWLTVV
jgi:hypothetical protein